MQSQSQVPFNSQGYIKASPWLCQFSSWTHMEMIACYLYATVEVNYSPTMYVAVVEIWIFYLSATLIWTMQQYKSRP